MIRFGTGGWRAIIADDFTKENIRLLTAGVCVYLEKHGHAGSTLCIGYDRRFLAKEAAHWIAEVLVAYGYRVMMISRSSPTPLIMFTVREKQLPMGLMVTASHNPAIYNGIKVITEGGKDADRQVTDEIETYIDGIKPEEVLSVEYEDALARGKICEEINSNAYLDSILSMIDTEAIRKKEIKVAIDPLFGVSQMSLSIILMTCRCNVEVIHGNHDTLFGGKMPAPSLQTLTPLSHYVVDKHCDLGIATDGDADRIGVIDECGRYVSANELLCLLYYYLVKYKGWNGACVRNNSTTHLLDRIAAGLGQECYEVPVGFKYISAKMIETDAVIGGESSGGLTVRGHIAGKDGIYAASLLTEMLAVTGKSISGLYKEITDLYGDPVYCDADFRMTHARKAELRRLLFEEEFLPDFGCKIERVNREDGVKTVFEDGSWVICRFSGTEPLLRMAAEADSREQAQRHIDAWRKALAL